MSRHHLTERIWLRLKLPHKFFATLGTSDTLGTLAEIRGKEQGIKMVVGPSTKKIKIAECIPNERGKKP